MLRNQSKNAVIRTAQMRIAVEHGGKETDTLRCIRALPELVFPNDELRCGIGEQFAAAEGFVRVIGTAVD